MKTVKEYKEEIRVQVSKYLARRDEIQYNTGQLHFLKGLFTSNLAVASPVHVKKPENILKHLDRTVFSRPNKEMRSFFDKRNNLEWFISSPYFEEIPEYIEYLEEAGDEYLPFALIQEAQFQVEQALWYFLALKSREEENDLEKNKAFLELLYSTALYEIFLTEYEGQLRQKHKYVSFRLKFMPFEHILQSGAFGEAERDIRAIIEKVGHGWTVLFYGHCGMYYVRHKINLFAVFRILMFVEYVSLNAVRGLRRGEPGVFLQEADIWKEQVLEWKKKDLFLPLKNNRNLHVLHDELNRICLRYGLYPHLKEGENRMFKDKVSGFEKDFMRYIEAAEACRRFPAHQRPQKAEEHLWEAAEQMALPVISAMEEILKIQENAKERREKNAETSWKQRRDGYHGKSGKAGNL